MSIDKPTTHGQLEVIKQKKFDTYFKVKDMPNTHTKDVDMTSRTVQVVTNTFYWFDSDQDVLIAGSTAKTINERGPQSKTDARIKNVYEHDMKVKVGVPKLMDERTINGNMVQYAESKIITSTKGNDTLIEYQEGAIDQHSIGFQYKDLQLVTADDSDWSKWLSLLINPKDAEAYGYMFIVKEIKQYEFSPVAFGANSLTPYLGVKSDNKDALTLKVFERIDWLGKQLKHGKQSDETMYDYSMETLQLKQIIHELFSQEPSIKDTLIKRRHNNEDTQKGNTSLLTCTNCMKPFTAPEGERKCPDCGQYVEQTNIVIPFDISKAIKETTFIKI